MKGLNPLNLVSAVAMTVQVLIFVYLYRSHRVRFFGYLVWAWALFVVWKLVSLAGPWLPEETLVRVLMGTGFLGELLVLAAGLAFRSGYRIRAWHLAAGALLALASPLLGDPWGIAESPLAPGGFASGGVLALAGLAFWPRRSPAPPPTGARFLATSLALWGLHRMVAPLVPAPAGSAALAVLAGTFVLFYFLSVFAIIILVLDRARAAAASLKEFNERLVDGLGEGLQLVDGDFTVRHVNRWMEHRFGPLVGRRCYDTLTADGRSCPGCPLGRRHELADPARLPVAGAGGRSFLLTGSPVRQPDGRVFLLELVADVTEPEQLRSRLSEAERMAAVGELAAGLAHEIRNPLAGIVNATTLLSQPEVLTDAERASILEAVKKEGRRLNATLSDFLSFARPREPERREGDVREVVDHVVSLLKSERPHPADIQVEIRVDPSVPTFVFDPDQLTQVVWNIVLNGVEAMQGRGRLRVEVGRRDGEVTIAVSDTGPGIAPDEQRRVFQPFYSMKRGGTGLGLAIARRIVSAHGGRIDLASAPGEGSRFTISLPIGKE